MRYFLVDSENQDQGFTESSMTPVLRVVEVKSGRQDSLSFSLFPVDPQ
jgi:hypothetical protein